VTTPAQRSALSALDAARPTITRLESDLNSEDRAAELIEGWSAVETALRSLMGGSPLTGRALIHEIRSRHIITLAQANALAEFEAARTRAQRPGYEPTQSDVNAGLDAFVKLEAGVRAASAAPATSSVAASAPVSSPAPAEPVGAPPPRAAWSAAAMAPRMRWALLGVAVLAVVGLGAWYYMSTRESTLDRAVAFYRAGQREQAQAAFERAAREDPRSALPHIYLSRMARDVGNLTLARDEANKAIQAEPTSALALREMGAYLLTSGNYELARRFYTRAVAANPADSTAMGYLGCASMRVGRVDEGQRWLARAGQGNWSSCATMAPGATLAPGAGMPGAVMAPGQQIPPQAPPRIP
jgi:tetratricopeptide (TPR) repeat protein